MKYDFTSIMDRKGMDSIAVEPGKDSSLGDFTLEKGFDLIPMWVADMNFPTAPSITEALVRRASHPAFGYFDVRDEYYDAIITWQKLRNGIAGIAKDDIAYDNGVLGGVATAMRVLCSPGDSLLVNSPTYIGFTAVLNNAGYHIVTSDLILDKDNIWRMDYDDMEKKIVENHIHVFILSSPHNPTGRVWRKDELCEMMDIFTRHDVYVISDEIWSDLTLYENKHIPTQSVSPTARERTIALYAPSKSFNLAGLVGSYRIVYNKWLRDRMAREASLSHYNSINVLSMHALIGAYSLQGAEWLGELKVVLGNNVDFAYEYILSHFDGVSLAKPEGTYMLFLDCEKWCYAHAKTVDDILSLAHRYGVLIQDGRPFHGKYHVRINLAIPLSRVQEAFSRLDRYVFNKAS